MVCTVTCVSACSDPNGPTLVSEAVHAGTIGREVWAAGMKHRLTDDVTVMDSLAVRPGVIICADPGVQLIVRGYLTAVGTSSEPIVMTACDSTAAWGGIHGLAISPDARELIQLKHVRLEHAVHAVSASLHMNVIIDSSVIRQIESDALEFEGELTFRSSVLDSVGLDGGVGILVNSGTITESIIRHTGGPAIVGARFSAYEIDGLRIDDAGGIGISAPFASVAATGPIRITGGQMQPVQMRLRDIMAIWPGAHIDSLRGNRMDTVLFRSDVASPAGEILVTPAVAWRGELDPQQADGRAKISGATTVRVQPGGSFGGQVVFAGGRLIAQGSPTERMALPGPLGFEGTAESLIEYADVSGGIFAQDTHVLTIRKTLFVAGSTVEIASAGSTLTGVLVEAPASADGVRIGAPGISAADLVIRNAALRALTIASAGVSIRNCEIHNNSSGIFVLAVADVTITDCNIYGNGGPGLTKLGASAINAVNNWWGDAAGPFGPAGDGVSGSVVYEPFRPTRVPLDTAVVYQ